jgi:soluble epoxide hydrolase / lipid-phosphate phosphatase
VPPESLALYSLKRAADDIKELARILDTSTIILGGHDWGGSVVYRTIMYHPDLVSHAFSVCTPFFPVNKKWTPFEEVVRTRLPHFGYQLHFASGEVEKNISTRNEIRQLLASLYEGRDQNDQPAFDSSIGPVYDRLPYIGSSPLVPDDHLDFYADQFARNGMHGPLNWYRTRRLNHEKDRAVLDAKIDIPFLFIHATRDHFLPESMSVGMEKYLPKLVKKKVESSHWALWEKPDEVNAILEEWLGKAGFLFGRSHL